MDLIGLRWRFTSFTWGLLKVSKYLVSRQSLFVKSGKSFAQRSSAVFSSSTLARTLFRKNSCTSTFASALVTRSENDEFIVSKSPCCQPVSILLNRSSGSTVKKGSSVGGIGTPALDQRAFSRYAMRSASSFFRCSLRTGPLFAGAA